MYNYYLNKNPQNNGDHEVHKESCYWLPSSTNRIFIGVFSNGIAAVRHAKAMYPTAKIDGCVHCCNEAHHS
jgi:hypothetical protein